MGKPERVQLSRRRGWRMPANTVKVDRSTRYGNPYQAGQDGDGDRAKLVQLYRALLAQPEQSQTVAEIQNSLRGKNLACWCPLDGPCHADVLLEIANAGASDRLEELLKRVRAATEPDRQLDADILKALGFHSWAGRMRYLDEQMWVDFGGSNITASVDAGLAVLERVLPGIWWVLAKGRMTASEPLYGCELLFGHDEQIAIADGANQPLAILAALLSALIAKEARP